MSALADIRIIALEQYGAGPFGSLPLADLGAEVIKIEDPAAGGDVGRYVPPYAEGEDSLFFEAFNRNKKSVSLDLRTTDGRVVFRDLVARADAVYSNLRGDQPERLGLTYRHLAEVNPRIVCCSLSGFGMTGPRAAEPGYDYILQGLTGWMTLTGEPGTPPQKTGLSLVDYSGGLAAALSLLAGVHSARRDGVGMDCDVALYDTAMSMLTYLATWHLTMGYEPGRTGRSAHPSLVPFQIFPAEDGWLVIGCAKDKFWARLTAVIGRPDLAEDSRFASFAARLANHAELQRILDDRLSTRTVDEWLRDLRAVSVPCAPVRGVADALRDEHTAERGLIVSTDHPQFGAVGHVASAVRVGPARDHHRRAPGRGEHTEEILRQVLGYDDGAIRRLRASGAFGLWRDGDSGMTGSGIPADAGTVT